MEKQHLESPAVQPFFKRETGALERFRGATLGAVFAALTMAATPTQAEQNNSIGAQVIGSGNSVNITINGKSVQTHGGGTTVYTRGGRSTVNTSNASREEAPSTKPSYYCEEDTSTSVEGPNNTVRNTMRYRDGTRVTIVHSTDEDGEESIQVIVKLPTGGKMETTCP